MSEYWKSTPKYWCKHCKTFVKDTKLEKANHEATPKHQGNLKRFLRDLHRGHEKDEKDKERAKSEVARLNGLVTGGGSGGGESSSSSGFGRGPTPSVPKSYATPAQRKQQLAQLAEMGVSIPDEFRPDMAMAGEWQVTSETVIDSNAEKKPDALAMGVRKRTLDEEETEIAEAKKMRWGSKFRSHPTEDDDGDLDALLSNATKKEIDPLSSFGVKNEDIKKEVGAGMELTSVLKDEEIEGPPAVKTELVDDETRISSDVPTLDAPLKEEGVEANGIVFKKRKAKPMRQK